MSTIAAVVVTYNRRELLLACVEHILAGTVVPSIIVVDNASTDGTQAALAPYVAAGQVTYFNTGANLGGAGGFNFGIRKAVELGFDALWIMDDDTLPTEAALAALLAADERLGGNYGWLSSKVLWTDGSICRMNVQRATLTRNVEAFDTALAPIVMASFVSLFVRADAVRRWGLPIKEFFIWTDDWEYTRRISREAPCYLVAESVAVHHTKANIAADISRDDANRLDRFRYLYRNDVCLYRREGIRGFIYECGRLTVHCLRVLIRSRDHRRKRLAMILKGTWAGIHFHPQIEYIDGRTKE